MKNITRKQIIRTIHKAVHEDRQHRSWNLGLPSVVAEVLARRCPLTPGLQELRHTHAEEAAFYRAALQKWILSPLDAARFVELCHDEALLCWLCDRDAAAAFALLEESREALTDSLCREHQGDSTLPLDFDSLIVNAELQRALCIVTGRPLAAAVWRRVMEDYAEESLRSAQEARVRGFRALVEEWADEDGNLPFH